MGVVPPLSATSVGREIKGTETHARKLDYSQPDDIIKVKICG